MENKKSNKGVIVTLIILIIMVLALGSYIVYDKFFNTENDKKVTENNVKDENKDDIKENDIKETYNAFTEKKLNIKLSNDFSIKFEQDYANDKPAGLIFMTSKNPNLGSSVNIHAPIPGYTTVKSIGAIENSTYKRILVFLTNENDQVNAWYTDIKNDDVSLFLWKVKLCVKSMFLSRLRKNGRKSGRIQRHSRLTRILLKRNTMFWRCFLIPPVTFIWAM